jgi:hypothetical protein
MTGIHRRTFLAMSGAFAVAPPAARAEIPLQRIDFEAVRNGSAIGTCTVQVGGDAQRLEVRINANIVVRLLGIALFRFTHEAYELWSNGRLVQMTTKTDDDGRAHRVAANIEQPGTIVVQTEQNRFTAPADTVPASLWNRTIVEARQFIDPVDGRVSPLAVQAIGHRTTETPTGAVDAMGYRLEGNGGFLKDVWYAADGTLVFIRMWGKDGSEVTYRRIAS